MPLINDDLCVVVRHGHPLLSKRRPSLEHLSRADWMLPGPNVTARPSLEGLFAQANLPPPRVAVEVSNMAGQLLGLLAHSDLVAITSELQLVGPAGRMLRPLPMAEARFPRRVGVVTRKGAMLGPLAQRSLEVLRERAG